MKILCVLMVWLCNRGLLLFLRILFELIGWIDRVVGFHVLLS